MRDESRNEGGSQDDRNFNSGMQEKKYFSGNGICSFLTNRMQDSFKTHDTNRDEKSKITRYKCYVKNCDFS